MPIPDLSNKPGPGRPGFGPTGDPYEFKFEVSAGQVGITVIPNINAIGFTITWQDGTSQLISSGQTNLQSPTTQAGIISINKETDTGFCDDFAVVSGQQFVTKVISWGQNPWNRMSSAFLNCTNLTDVGVTSFKTDASGTCNNMFQNCTSLLELNASNWDLSLGWQAISFIQGCTNLTKVDMTGLSIKVRARSENLMYGVGTSVANGCKFLMSGINFLSGTYGLYQPNWFFNSKMSPTSTFANWSWDNSISDWIGTAMFYGVDVTGVDSTLDVSGWSTFPGSTLNSWFNSVNYTVGVTNNRLTVDLTGLNVSNVSTMTNFCGNSDIYKIKGISGFGATAGNVNMSGCFYESTLLKIPTSDNFSDAFIQSLTPTNIYGAFRGIGRNLPESDLEASINLNGFDASNVSAANGFTTTWYQYHSNTSLDFSNVTFPSTSQIFSNTWSQAYAHESNSTLNFPNQLVSSSFSSSFAQTQYDNIILGNNVDFSQVTTVQSMFYYAKTGVNITFPTADSGLSFASLVTTANWFAGTLLTTCQVDNLIRSFRATAYGNALNVNFYQSKITEAPSVVRTQEAELVANGWFISENSTDAVMPFVYTTPVVKGVDQIPTGSFTGGTFSSSDAANIPVNASTGEIDATNAGNVTIRYTITATGCYNEQALVVADPSLAQINNVYSMEFDGASDFITISNPISLPNDFTISAWIYPTRVDNSYEMIYTQGDGPGAVPFYFSVQDTKLHVYITGIYQTGLNFITADEWQHVAVTRTSGVLNLYRNGVEYNGSRPTQNGTINTNNPGVIGKWYNSLHYFKGNIDEVGIFNTALTDTEIERIYNATALVGGVVKTADLSQLTTPPLKWYRMGD